jgi:hypothetical protein
MKSVGGLRTISPSLKENDLFWSSLRIVKVRVIELSTERGGETGSRSASDKAKSSMFNLPD